MKPSLHIALLCFSLIAFAQKEKSANRGINADFTIGRHGQDCSGRGLCSFNTALNKSVNPSTLVNYKDNTLTFIIQRTKISIDVETKIADKPIAFYSKETYLTFVMEDDFILDVTTIVDLKLPIELTKIAKGIYPLKVLRDTIIFTVNLQ